MKTDSSEANKKQVKSILERLMKSMDDNEFIFNNRGKIVNALAEDDFNTETLIRLADKMNEEEDCFWRYELAFLRNIKHTEENETADDLSIVDEDIEDLDKHIQLCIEHNNKMKALRERIVNNAKPKIN